MNASTEKFQEPSPPQYYASSPIEAERDANALIHSYIDENLPIVRGGKIAQPVCIPQMHMGFDMPFARGYAPSLAEKGISQDTFIDFIDGLNTAMIASPPLQIVDLAGIAIGFVPHVVFILVGGGIQAGAQIGIRVLSKTLTDRYMRAANERIFAPAGLRARICKAPAMRALAKVPWVVPPPSPPRMKRVARYMGDTVLWLPLTVPPVQDRIRKVMDDPPTVDSSIADPLVRRMKPYVGYTLPLTFDVPPPNAPSNVVKKLSDYAVNFRRKNWTKKVEDGAARRQILAGVPVTRELTKRDKKAMKKLAEGKEIQIRRKVIEDDRRESRAIEKGLWLVIVNEDEDRLIQGSERVDDSSDEVAFDGEEIAMANREHEGDLTDSDDSVNEYEPTHPVSSPPPLGLEQGSTKSLT